MKDRASNGIMYTLIVLLFTGAVVWAFTPALSTFFGPQSFLTFLNPLKNEVPFLQYLKEGWSWENNQGELIGFFRPLSSVLYMIEYPVFDVNPLGYKLISFCLHLLCSILAGSAVFRLSGRKGAGFAAGMLFAVHPGSLDAVGLVSARPDILAALFSILAVTVTLSLTRVREFNARKAILPALFAFLALLAKELGVANLFALPVLFFMWPGVERNKKNGIVLIASLAVVAFAYFGVRFGIFGGVGGYDSTAGLDDAVRWIPVIILQASGAAFVHGTARVMLLAVELFLLALFLYRKRGEGVRMLVTGVMVTGIYSFQSVLSFPEPHYVYTSAMFSVLFMVCFISIAGFTENRFRISSIVLLAGMLTGSVLVVRKEAQVFRVIATPPGQIYYGLSALTDELMELPAQEYLIPLTGADTPELREMKNAPKYLDYLYQGSSTFLLTVEPAPPGVPVITWDGSGVALQVELIDP